MPVLCATTLIHAPADVVFDLARDVREHTASLVHTAERVVPPGRVSGLLEEGDLVCFRARHFGLPLALDARVLRVDAPRSFTDEQVRGPFRSLRHDHVFVATGAGTLMTDRIVWESPLGVVGRLADEVAVRRQLLSILTARNTHLKRRAEVRASAP
ncbi:SRPBCC family protein [Cryptosporangium aurantiacum]|uniref:Polyketide cyclase / dehydrase and lipid transport n=1 Tax=Cryptosporangium aurantiacum TaxID=134849 RepID=A0A1M7QQH1_9ACTN|nr:SRPBCC family protein [Cryptosporangium aurantiacum]SHN33834.1 Polyketide cyclase / dehydrase and lipid transport [Cryptosporangium aurantiacum]